jgi:hypothetical protein
MNKILYLRRLELMYASSVPDVKSLLVSLFESSSLEGFGLLQGVYCKGNLDRHINTIETLSSLRKSDACSPPWFNHSSSYL